MVLFTANTSMAADAGGTSGGDMWRLGIGPTLGILNSQVGFGGTATGEYQLSNIPLSIGLQSGFIHWSPTGTSQNAIPVLATGTYYFPMQGFTPYFGIGVGIGINLISVGSVSQSNVYFMGLAKPGVEMSLTPGMTLLVEPDLGIYNSSFLFLPTVGLKFKL